MSTVWDLRCILLPSRPCSLGSFFPFARHFLPCSAEEWRWCNSPGPPSQTCSCSWPESLRVSYGSPDFVEMCSRRVKLLASVKRTDAQVYCELGVGSCTRDCTVRKWSCSWPTESCHWCYLSLLSCLKDAFIQWQSSRRVLSQRCWAAGYAGAKPVWQSASPLIDRLHETPLLKWKCLWALFSAAHTHSQLTLPS